MGGPLVTPVMYPRIPVSPRRHSDEDARIYCIKISLSGRHMYNTTAHIYSLKLLPMASLSARGGVPAAERSLHVGIVAPVSMEISSHHRTPSIGERGREFLYQTFA